MDDFQTSVVSFLKNEFPGLEPDFGPISGSDRISGVLTWAGFAGKDFTERQKVVWDALRNNFRENSIRISTIVTLTPEELRDYSASS